MHDHSFHHLDAFLPACVARTFFLPRADLNENAENARGHMKVTRPTTSAAPGCPSSTTTTMVKIEGKKITVTNLSTNDASGTSEHAFFFSQLAGDVP